MQLPKTLYIEVRLRLIWELGLRLVNRLDMFRKLIQKLRPWIWLPSWEAARNYAYAQILAKTEVLMDIFLTISWALIMLGNFQYGGQSCGNLHPHRGAPWDVSQAHNGAPQHRPWKLHIQSQNWPWCEPTSMVSLARGSKPKEGCSVPEHHCNGYVHYSILFNRVAVVLNCLSGSLTIKS